MASCLVLGGAGFIGSHLAEALLQAGHRVRIFDRPHLDRLPGFLQRRELEVFTGDFLNPRALSPEMASTAASTWAKEASTPGTVLAAISALLHVSGDRESFP